MKKTTIITLFFLIGCSTPNIPDEGRKDSTFNTMEDYFRTLPVVTDTLILNKKIEFYFDSAYSIRVYIRGGKDTTENDYIFVRGLYWRDTVASYQYSQIYGRSYKESIEAAIRKIEKMLMIHREYMFKD